MFSSSILLPRPDPIARAISLGVALFACVGAMILALWEAATVTPWWFEYLIATLPLIGSLALVRAAYSSNAAYLFSTGFWLSTTVIFYILLKSVDLIVREEDIDRLNTTIWTVTLFMYPFAMGYRRAMKYFAKKLAESQSRVCYDVVLTPRARFSLLCIFLAFKGLGIILSLTAGGGNALEVAAATQNNGAAYLYKIPLAANSIFLLVLYDSFKNKRGWTIAAIMGGFFLAEAVISTSRLSIVMAVLWVSFLYHRYKKPIKISTVALIGGPLVVVIALFGYARNLEVGSWDAYLQGISVLSDNPALLSELFLARLDMLPEMMQGVSLYQAGQLPTLGGGSYIYMLLHAVPRNIWESKPLLTAALVTSITHPGAFEDGVNIFPSIIVETLINLGWAGLLIIGTVVGVCCAWYEKILNSNLAIPTTWALTFFTFPMGLFNEGFHSNFTANLLYSTALIFVILKSLTWSKILRTEPIV